MRKYCVFVLTFLLLSGCGSQETFETVSDELIQSVSAQTKEVMLTLPADAVSPAAETEYGEIYLCGDYDIHRQTLEAGDLNATIQTISGYSREDLTVLETRQVGYKRYEFVWVSAGEIGDRVGHGVILDDGNYHYCLSVLGDAETANLHQSIWQSMFDSFKLI